MESLVELPGQRVCRVLSSNEKKGRFTVENLNHVRCALISDKEKLCLLQTATTSAHFDDEHKLAEARLTLSMKESPRKTSEDHYVMQVIETHIDDCECFNFGDPHVIICAVSTEEKFSSLDRIASIRKKLESHEWVCPIILLAYHSEHESTISYDVMKELKELSRNPKIFRCMEATALNRNLLRHCLAMALLAARPFLAAARAEKDVCIDDINDDGDKKTRTQSIEGKPRKDFLHVKHSFSKSCRIQ
ncbi:unnamed protein product [Cylicocyclus nassatus]|uniref:Uncharacterized protein n=1 Tax=Cylicocyclus nassatus TaxID=53992 RepID=A0AA36M5F0_CYLNA|nr:unnamed protein product [Cylicocyclus nassatus]